MNDEQQADVAKAKAIADKIREVWPEKAAEIDKLIAEVVAGRRDSLKVSGSVALTLKKFDGEYSPDKEPVEVIHSRDEL